MNHKTRKPQFKFKKKFEYKHLTDFQKEKEELKYNLMHLRSVKDIEKEKEKKSSAQALKFLRKLGRKLRRP